jgi:hypothetical protein
MLKKNSFKNQAAVITSLNPDYEFTPVNDRTNITFKYVEFTTQAPHNFTAGSKVTINGLYKTSDRGVEGTPVLLNDAVIVRTKTANKFTIEVPREYYDRASLWNVSPVEGTISNAVGNGTTVTYTYASGAVVPGLKISVSGLGVYSGESLNLQDVIITATTATTITVASVVVGQSFGTGVYNSIQRGVLDFNESNHYVNSSGLGSNAVTFVGPFYAPTWDLFKVNPFVTAYVSDGPMSAYTLNYGDPV